MLSTVHLAELAALGTAVLWTCSTLIWTSAGRYVGALAVSFVRLLITCVMLMVYGRLVRGLWFPSDASGETWMLLGVSGFIGFFVTDLCLIKALLLLGPRLTLLFQSLAPPIAALLSFVVLGDRLTPLDWLAMAITLTGVTWVVLERSKLSGKPHLQHRPLGVCLALAAAVGQAAGLVLSKQGLGNYDAVAATFIRVLGSMGGYLVLVTVLGRWGLMWRAALHPRAMGLMTLGAFAGPFLGVILSMIALRNCQAGVVATIISTMPVLVLPAVIVLYREKVSLRAAIGAAISVVGVALLVLW